LKRQNWPNELGNTCFDFIYTGAGALKRQNYCNGGQKCSRWAIACERLVFIACYFELADKEKKPAHKHEENQSLARALSLSGVFCFFFIYIVTQSRRQLRAAVFS